jgi:hypothetical protein
VKHLLIKSVIKVLIAFALCALISTSISLFAPHISNELALGQLENDNFSWTIMQSWNKLVTGLGIVKPAIVLVCGISVGTDTYNYIKNRKEN